MIEVNILKHSTKNVSLQLRLIAENANLEFSLIAIDGLGELGGYDAIEHIIDLMDIYSINSSQDNNKRWNALISAYKRAVLNGIK